MDEKRLQYEIGGNNEMGKCILYFEHTIVHYLLLGHCFNSFSASGKSFTRNLLKKTMFYTKHEIKCSVYICYLFVITFVFLDCILTKMLLMTN